MRRILVPFSGNTDANGNASLSLPLERTGDWRDVKVAVQTTGFPEWGLFSLGTPLDFRRGRRAVLGPELLEPFDTLTLQVNGAQPSASIVGSVGGVGGTMEEITQRYAPSSGMVALDTASPILPLKQNASDTGIYTVQPGAVQTNVPFIIPTGVQSVRWEINQLGVSATWTGAKIVGNVTGKQYNTGTSNPGNTGGFDETWELDPEDTQLLWSINTTGSANAIEYWLNGHLGANFVATKIVQNFDGEPVFVRNDSTPAPWQAASSIAIFDGSLGGGVSQTVITGVAGQQIYLFGITISFDTVTAGCFGFFMDTNTSTKIGTWSEVAASESPKLWYLAGAKLPGGTGAGLKITNASGVAANGLHATISYRQV